MERLGVYYSDLVPVLINAIKEQQQIIKAQDAKIEGLEVEAGQSQELFDQLLERIEALEAIYTNTHTSQLSESLEK